MIASCSTDTSTSSAHSHADDDRARRTTTTWPHRPRRCHPTSTTTHDHDAHDREVAATTTPPAASAEVAAVFVGGPRRRLLVAARLLGRSGWVQVGEEGEATPLEFPAATGDAAARDRARSRPGGDEPRRIRGGVLRRAVGFAVDVAVPPPSRPVSATRGSAWSATGRSSRARPTRSASRSTSTARSGRRSPTTSASTARSARSCRWCEATSTATGWRRCSSRSSTPRSRSGAPGDYSIVYVRARRSPARSSTRVVFSSFVEPDLPDEELPFMNLAARARRAPTSTATAGWRSRCALVLRGRRRARVRVRRRRCDRGDGQRLRGVSRLTLSRRRRG